MDALYGGIEAGGTKFICAVGTGPDNIRARTRIPTTTPTETLQRTIDFFHAHEKIAALGIGTFGPIDLNRASPTFGYITATPKSGWANTDFVGTLQRALHVPIGFDTDVNAAALGEQRWGAAQRLANFIYLTIGTGIGGGAMVNGQLLHGLIHPEMGHVRVPHDWSADPFTGTCPFHGDCLEGLASGPAIHARWGQTLEALPPNHPAWELEAQYLAHALANFICTLLPQRLILGGGVMQQAQLWPLIWQKVPQLLNGYIHAPEIFEKIEQYIVAPGLGARAGILGALALAQAVRMT